MIQCIDCEFAEVAPDGAVSVRCNPLTNVKEPECLAKWQLMRTEALVQAYGATVSQYRRLAPLQEKMMKMMEREIDEVEEADSWKLQYDEDDAADDEDDDNAQPL